MGISPRLFFLQVAEFKNLFGRRPRIVVGEAFEHRPSPAVDEEQEPHTVVHGTESAVYVAEHDPPLESERGDGGRDIEVREEPHARVLAAADERSGELSAEFWQTRLVASKKQGQDGGFEGGEGRRQG